MAVLIDTSFLLAVASRKDRHHAAARAAMQALKAERIVPLPVISELFYLLTQREHYPAAIRMFATLRTAGFRIETLTPADFARMEAIMTQYMQSRFDFADTAIMALSERLGITELYTFDRRDFTTFLPSHCDYLELLP
jgi:hypothetical protein